MYSPALAIYARKFSIDVNVVGLIYLFSFFAPFLSRLDFSANCSLFISAFQFSLRLLVFGLHSGFMCGII